jgi:hypothetical protein
MAAQCRRTAQKSREIAPEQRFPINWIQHAEIMECHAECFERYDDYMSVKGKEADAIDKERFYDMMWERQGVEHGSSRAVAPKKKKR